MKTKGLISLIFLQLLTSCGLFDSGSDKIVDDYEVTWIDLHEQRALYKHEVLVPAYVFAAGYNDSFVFAKQHPLLPQSADKIDKSTTNYYLIHRTKNFYQDRPRYGPMTKASFDSLCIQLKITDTVFGMTYPTNLY